MNRQLNVNLAINTSSFQPETRLLISEKDQAADKSKTVSRFIYNVQERIRDGSMVTICNPDDLFVVQ